MVERVCETTEHADMVDGDGDDEKNVAEGALVSSMPSAAATSATVVIHGSRLMQSARARPRDGSAGAHEVGQVLGSG